MKRITFIILLLTTRLIAQVPNPGFEYLNPDFSATNWGNMYVINLTDSIVVDGYFFYAPSPDAHSGQYAMELRNAMNFTTGEVIVGAVSADADSVFPGWGLGPFPLQTAPDHLGFYYKYFPVGNDMAMATMTVFDAGGNMLGDVNIVISGTAASYTYASAAINYTTVGVPATAFINFSNAIPGSPANFGTHFLIDDVEINPVTAVDESSSAQGDLEIFPNPAKTNLTVRRNSNDFNFYIYNVAGQPVQVGLGQGGTATIPVGNLSPGIYIMEISDESGVERRKFMIEY